MPTNTTRLQLPYPGPGDAFKPASIDFPALANRLDAVAARQPGDVIVAAPVLDIGQVGQIRAGRVLTAADFTALLGLSAPVALWNLSSTADSSGSGRTLTNKGTVPFGVGILGAAASAAVFAGSTAQALYIADTGAADPFRIRMGSWGAWTKTAKRATGQGILAKVSPTSTTLSGFTLQINTDVAQAGIWDSSGASIASAVAISDIADDRWHHVVATWDGSYLRVYVDGVLEVETRTVIASQVINPNSSGPLNIGAVYADGATAATTPHYGRVDEAFVTSDVLNDDQVRLLYAGSIAHSYAVQPTRAHLGVTRRRRGLAHVVGDFPTTPLRLHTFTAGALGDSGSLNVALTLVNTPTVVAGADGVAGGAYATAAANTLRSSDAGLPTGTASRSLGCWVKTATLLSAGIMAYGSGPGNGIALHVVSGALQVFDGTSTVTSNAYVGDGAWHHVVLAQDNSAADGLKTKLYCDGRLVASTTALLGPTLTLAGVNGFLVGRSPTASDLTGVIDAVFVCGYALTAEQVRSLYQKAGQSLPVSTKDEGIHVEAMDATNAYVVFDALEPQHVVDLKVAGS